MCGVRRVREYTSSFIDLKNFIRKDTGCSLGEEPPQGNDQSPRTANAKEHKINWLIQKELQKVRFCFLKVYGEGGGVTAKKIRVAIELS